MATQTSLSFQLPSVSGKAIGLDSYPGAQGYAVIFTCNHCPYAVAYEDRLIQLQQEFGDRVPVIAISVNDAQKYPQDSFENMKVRAQTKGFNFEYLYDETQAVAHAYGAERTPHAFLLDANQRVIYSGSIDDNYRNASEVSEHFLREAIMVLLNGNEQKVMQTMAIGCSIKWK